MSNSCYYNKNGEKIGPISVSALKELTRQGLITRDTIIENQQGRSSVAGKVNGLIFPDTSPPPVTNEVYGLATPSTNPFIATPSVEVNPFTAPVPIVPSTMKTGMASIPQPYDYRRIASLYRLSNWAVLLFPPTFFLPIIAATSTTLKDSYVFIWMVLIQGILIFHLVCVLHLERATRSCAARIVILFVGWLFAGGVGIYLLIVGQLRAGQFLRRAGYRVSFFGVDMRQFDNTKIDD